MGSIQSSACQLTFAFLFQSHISWLDWLEFPFEEKKKSIPGLVSSPFVHGSHSSIFYRVLISQQKKKMIFIVFSGKVLKCVFYALSEFTLSWPVPIFSDQFKFLVVHVTKTLSMLYFFPLPTMPWLDDYILLFAPVSLLRNNI